MKIQAKIQKWGNGLALRVGGAMRDIPKLKDGTIVEVEITEEGFNVRRPTVQKIFPFTEDEILSDLTPESAHADILADPKNSEFEY